MLIVLLFYGCAMTAPKYSPNYDSIIQIRKSKLNKLQISKVIKDPDSKNEIEKLSIRASSYNSPYGSFVDYLKEAIKQTLEESKLYSENSNLSLSAFLIKNEVDSSIPRGRGEITVRFVLNKSEVIVYDSIKVGRTHWESSFFGSVAIAEAAQNYPKVYQSLIDELFQDPIFINSLK